MRAVRMRAYAGRYVIPEGEDQTPAHEVQARELERDVLAERRARRAGLGEAGQLRRAEAAEATVQALERRLTELRRDQLEAERARERATEQLADREHELRRVKQREYAEQQLRVEAEDNMTRLRRRHRSELERLQRRVEESRAAAHTAGERTEAQRLRAEERRLEAERQCAQAEERRIEAERRHALAEQQRRQAEREREALAERLAAVSESCARMQQGILVLEAAAAALRAEVEQERGVAQARIQELERECAASEARVRALEQARRSLEAQTSSPVPQEQEQQELMDAEARREEMAGALAAAVQRLRARVAAVGELDEPATGAATETAVQTPPAETPVVQVAPRMLAPPVRREAWLAPAIRRIAERRDARLAAELVTELLPAQRLVLKRPLVYDVRIAELDGPWRVRIENGHTEVAQLTAAEEPGAQFALAGRAADFAELAAGGTGRTLRGLQVHGRRRQLRGLRRVRRDPLDLWDLAAAGIEVWPGLLLLALAEAIDPSWTVGQRFTVAFEIQSRSAPASARMHVQARDGAALGVISTAPEPPQATVRISERAFMCMLAGAALPAGERVLVEGETGPLELLIEWFDRAQGRSAGQAELRRSHA
jgi:hypothetical protein